tara:strand:+ start:75 stop:1004 length:930 start_codon:yes stop_codon:yes gene_type:complete
MLKMKTFCLLLMGTFSNTSSLTSSSPYCGPNTVKKTFKHKSFDIKYQQAGDPSNPPVLLIHGFGASSSHFRYNIPVLAVKNCVYAIDLLGFGDSSKPKDLTFTMDTFTTLCEDFIQSTPPCPSNHNKWIVAGNSIGGLTAINLAASSKVKELIRGVILFNSSGGLSSFRYADYPFYLRPILFVVQNVVLKNFGAAFYKNFKTKENVLQILNEQVYADTTNVDEPLVDMLLAPSDDDGAQEVSERSERVFWKTSILAMKCAKWLQTDTSTTKLTHSFVWLLHSFHSSFIKMLLASLGAGFPIRFWSRARN